MTFIELVEEVSKNSGIPKAKVKKALYATGGVIRSHLIHQDATEVKWIDFGRFSRRKTKRGKAFGHELQPRNTIKFKLYQ